MDLLVFAFPWMTVCSKDHAVLIEALVFANDLMPAKGPVQQLVLCC